MLTNIIFWVLLGALAGWIASMIMGRDSQMGAGANIVVGIIQFLAAMSAAKGGQGF